MIHNPDDGNMYSKITGSWIGYPTLTSGTPDLSNGTCVDDFYDRDPDAQVKIANLIAKLEMLLRERSREFHRDPSRPSTCAKYTKFYGFECPCEL